MLHGVHFQIMYFQIATCYIFSISPCVLAGNISLDRRITNKMLRWVLVDIKKTKNVNKQGIMSVTDAHVQFISDMDSSDVLLEHNVHTISQFSRCQRDRKCLFYLQRNNPGSPFVMFAFVCDQEDKVCYC